MSLAQPDISIELQDIPNMDRSEGYNTEGDAHEPLLRNEEQEHPGAVSENGTGVPLDETPERPFSWYIYSIFVLLGIAMLWAWNMFMAAAPYFQRRFGSNSWILDHFQAAETSVATCTILASMLVLSSLQKNASYTKRIIISLLLYIALFTILAFSTLLDTSVQVYFGFLLVVICATNLGTGFIQNGVYSYVAGFGRKEYTQAIMTGQAVAGVLPPLAQIISVSLLPAKSQGSGSTAQSPKAAFTYFITATAVSGITLFAFIDLLRREAKRKALQTRNKVDGDEIEDDHTIKNDESARKPVPLTQAFMKVPFLALAVILCFGVTMAFPVLTNMVESVSGIDRAIFIPIALLTWNVGDLIGRQLPLIPGALLTHHPVLLFVMAGIRSLYIPLYFVCNIKGRGAIVNSDLFYLVIVQATFGMSNGYIGSSCMMGAGDWVLPEEREAVGGFMALCIVIGLTVGSLASFSLGNI